MYFPLYAFYFNNDTHFTLTAFASAAINCQKVS